MPKPAKPKGAGMEAFAVICEPGRHVGCLHAKMAEKRAAAKGKGR